MNKILYGAIPESLICLEKTSAENKNKCSNCKKHFRSGYYNKETRGLECEKCSTYFK